MNLDQIHIIHCMLYELKKGSSATEELKIFVQLIEMKLVWPVLIGNFFSFLKIPFDLDVQNVNNGLLQIIIEESSKQTARKLVEQFNTSHISVIKHLHKLGTVSKLG